MNLDYTERDYIYVLVWSENDPKKIPIMIEEVGINTGIFEGVFISSTTDRAGLNLVRVSQNDQVHILYLDITTPKNPHEEIYSTSTIGNYKPQSKEIKQEQTNQNSIPEWVKNIFKFYVENKISEDELIQALQFLIKQGILKV